MQWYNQPWIKPLRGILYPPLVLCCIVFLIADTFLTFLIKLGRALVNPAKWLFMEDWK